MQLLKKESGPVVYPETTMPTNNQTNSKIKYVLYYKLKWSTKSTTRHEYPHSLSYHESTFTVFP